MYLVTILSNKQTFNCNSVKPIIAEVWYYNNKFLITHRKKYTSDVGQIYENGKYDRILIDFELIERGFVCVYFK